MPSSVKILEKVSGHENCSLRHLHRKSRGIGVGVNSSMMFTIRFEAKNDPTVEFELIGSQTWLIASISSILEEGVKNRDQ